MLGFVVAILHFFDSHFIFFCGLFLADSVPSDSYRLYFCKTALHKWCQVLLTWFNVAGPLWTKAQHSVYLSNWTSININIPRNSFWGRESRISFIYGLFLKINVLQRCLHFYKLEPLMGRVMSWRIHSSCPWLKLNNFLTVLGIFTITLAVPSLNLSIILSIQTFLIKLNFSFLRFYIIHFSFFFLGIYFQTSVNNNHKQ